ncbi:beta-N-acetylhexosaminidase [Alistipes sp.]|uniref:beta-N-acetylhexosaminidase n=1 Tax=Alistipes sp. TaxID=1872444 RepID=UPI003AF02203
MKLRILILLAALFAGLDQAHAQPAPACRTDREGAFELTRQTAICFEKGLAPLADYLLEHTNVETASDRISSDPAVVLETDPALADEAYRLDIGTERIRITGGGYGGVFNGIQTLLRELPPEVYAKACPLPVRIGCTAIEDAPRFAYRGMLLDVVRTWMDADAVKRYIDLLAYHSINKLHLVLSNDEGWRIEIRSHPELAPTGGFRGGDSPVRAIWGKWEEKYGGYYTQQQMRGIVAYAAQRNIEIIPEIDLPGHSRAFGSVYPEIRCNYRPDTVSTNGYDYRSAWCVAREANYGILEDILGEICALFPSEYIHVGGDEVDMSQWERCPDCRALMRRLVTDDPHRLEDLFMERMAAILEANGKRPGVWNEAVRTGAFTRRSRAYGWESIEACLDAADKGYPTVVMPGQYFYFDMRQSQHEEGHQWAAIFDARKVYGFDPAELGFTPARMQHVAGLEGSFFSEAYVSHEPEKPDYMDYMCFPRICALSAVAWGSGGEWEEYYRALHDRHYDRLAAMGIRFRLFPPAVRYEKGLFSASTDDGAEIRYLVGDSPEEHRYMGPIRTDNPHLFRFFTRYKTARSPYVADKSFYRTAAPALTLTSSMGESRKFPYANASSYRGASCTARACREGDWVLYAFDKPVACREMFLQTGTRHLPKYILTTGYAEVSYDGTTFERVAELEKGAVTLRPEKPVRAVRLVSTCRDNGTPYVMVQPPVVKPVL